MSIEAQERTQAPKNPVKFNASSMESLEQIASQEGLKIPQTTEQGKNDFNTLLNLGYSSCGRSEDAFRIYVSLLKNLKEKGYSYSDMLRFLNPLFKRVAELKSNEEERDEGISIAFVDTCILLNYVITKEEFKDSLLSKLLPSYLFDLTYSLKFVTYPSFEKDLRSKAYEAAIQHFLPVYLMNSDLNTLNEVLPSYAFFTEPLSKLLKHYFDKDLPIEFLHFSATLMANMGIQGPHNFSSNNDLLELLGKLSRAFEENSKDLNLRERQLFYDVVAASLGSPEDVISATDRLPILARFIPELLMKKDDLELSYNGLMEITLSFYKSLTDDKLPELERMNDNSFKALVNERVSNYLNSEDA